MNNHEPQNFFDARTITAILIVMVTFVGWQTYMARKYPDTMSGKKPAPTAETPAAQNPSAPADTAKAPAGAQTKTVPADPTKLEAAPQAEKIIAFTSENLSFEISSRGMGLKSIKLNKYKDRKGDVVDFGQPDTQTLSLETRLLGRQEPLHFSIEKINDTHFVGRASVGTLQIAKTMEIDPDKYLIQYKINVTGEDERFIGLTTSLTEEVHPFGESSFLMPLFEKQEFYLNTAETDERLIIDKEDKQASWSKVKLATLGSQYFTQAIMDRSAIMPEAKGSVDHKAKSATLNLQYSVLNKGAAFDLDYMAFVGPKSHSLLVGINEDLAKVVDFGFFNWIGRQILSMLKWFHGLVGNWGVAIILLTIGVRFLVLPFNVYSYKSMKAMQAIQPQLQALRERYKDDPAKQQQETMALMKEHRVNPLGGCLPVLLQFPIWLALYQVLGNSIELYQADFGLWIHDLSLKDPFYILPVLMGVTMFIQQKITPTTMDPAQAKVMLFMPLIFIFFMFPLPSGLTLYMWVGAIFSVLQQLYFMRDGSAAAAPSRVR